MTSPELPIVYHRPKRPAYDVRGVVRLQTGQDYPECTELDQQLEAYVGYPDIQKSLLEAYATETHATAQIPGETAAAPRQRLGNLVVGGWRPQPW